MRHTALSIHLLLQTQYADGESALSAYKKLAKLRKREEVLDSRHFPILNL